MRTSKVTDTISLPGLTPDDEDGRPMTLSPDGHTLYIADYTNNDIDEIDTQSLSLIRTLPVNSPFAIAAGLDNRLYISQLGPEQGVIQIDATSGAAVGNPLPDVSNASWLQMSPDQKTLYVANAMLTPTQVLRFDVTTTTPPLPYQGGFLLNNGVGLNLNHTGTMIAAPGGTNGVTMLDAPTLFPLGVLDASPGFPVAATFSPDDKLVYVSVQFPSYAIDVFDTTTFSQVGQFATPSLAGLKTVDTSGRELFVSFADAVQSFDGTIVYDTGVPEPATILLAGIAICGFALVRSGRLTCLHSWWR